MSGFVHYRADLTKRRVPAPLRRVIPSVGLFPTSPHRSTARLIGRRVVNVRLYSFLETTRRYVTTLGAKGDHHWEHISIERNDRTYTPGAAKQTSISTAMALALALPLLGRSLNGGALGVSLRLKVDLRRDLCGDEIRPHS
jgi:hypothetical protein